MNTTTSTPTHPQPAAPVKAGLLGHTPGPWNIKTFRYLREPDVFEIENGFYVATVEGENAEANARSQSLHAQPNGQKGKL